MRIEVIDRRAVSVACFRYTGPLGDPLARFWRTSVTPWLAEHGLLDCPRYGVTLDNPGSTPPEECRYDACVELPRGMTLASAVETTIAGGRYAVTHFKGTGEQIGAAWDAFVDASLGNPVNQRDPTRPALEHYPRGASYDPKTRVFACELCLPLL